MMLVFIGDDDQLPSGGQHACLPPFVIKNNTGNVGTLNIVRVTSKLFIGKNGESLGASGLQLSGLPASHSSYTTARYSYLAPVFCKSVHSVFQATIN